MFGHDNQSQHHDDVQSPDDGAANDQGMTMPPVDDGSEDFTGAVQAPAGPTPAATVAPVEPAAAVAATTAPAAPAATPANADHLLDLKQQALQQLTPLINHLEQSPEEKFRTTMMLIQASDNDVLLSAAYDAALEIPDEKVRAQALLDIVNEINYFTHSSGSTPEA
jgi:hypothetical protein